ncbi:16S rRNA (guanine(527)-N(7))-methyltransferase RsmG [Elusimicrobiota bacterium]
MNNIIKSWFTEKTGQYDNGIQSRLDAYLDLLIKEKKIRNIIGSDSEKVIVEDHMIPSLELALMINGTFGVDVGSGNGLPGIIISILRPNMQICLMESKESRVNFLGKVKKELGIKNIIILKTRAEEAGRNENYREKFNFATCRAVADLKISCELILPLLTIDSIYYAQRGQNVGKDIENAGSIIKELGGTIENITGDNIVLVRKKNRTHQKYPRKWKKIIS